MPHRLRFFFDPGAGVCLWAADDATRERFGYPVPLAALPLTERTRAEGERLIERFDASVSWPDPGGPPRWAPADTAAFEQDARVWLAAAQAELGSAYEIADELVAFRLD